MANQADQLRHGTAGRVLAAEQVQAIRAAADESREQLAERFGITPAMVSHIRTGRAWSRVAAA